MNLKSTKNLEYKKWWNFPFLIYILPNALMSAFVYLFGILFVDGVPIPFAQNSIILLYVFLLILLSYFFIKKVSFYFYNLANKYDDSKPSKYVGYIIFILQLIDLASLLLLDFGRVGGVALSTNIVAVFISYIPSDILFLLYYGHIRKYKLPYYNLGIFIILNLLKGWTAIFVILFLIEIYFLLFKFSYKKIVKKGLLFFILIIFLYPSIDKFKFYIRGGEEYKGGTLIESVSGLMTRLQHATNAILIYQEQTSIKNAVIKGEIYPYYLDNRFGNYLIPNNSLSLQKYLSVNYLIDRNVIGKAADLEEYSWNTHIGITGWFLILDKVQLMFYLLFITVLLMLPFLINHFFLKAKDVLPVIQTLVFIYLFHGWFTVQFSFVFGMILYVFLCGMFRRKFKSDLV